MDQMEVRNYNLQRITGTSEQNKDKARISILLQARCALPCRLYSTAILQHSIGESSPTDTSPIKSGSQAHSVLPCHLWGMAAVLQQNTGLLISYPLESRLLWLSITTITNYFLIANLPICNTHLEEEPHLLKTQLVTVNCCLLTTWRKESLNTNTALKVAQ